MARENEMPVQSGAAGPRQVRLLTALLLFAMFCVGAIAGAGLARWVGPSLPSPPPPPLGGDLPPELRLTSAQRAQAEAIHERHRPELEAILRETYPRVRAINEQMEQELRAILTEEQKRELDRAKALRPPPPHPLGRPGGLRPPLPPPPGMSPPPDAPPSPDAPSPDALPPPGVRP